MCDLFAFDLDVLDIDSVGSKRFIFANKIRDDVINKKSVPYDVYLKHKSFFDNDFIFHEYSFKFLTNFSKYKSIIDLVYSKDGIPDDILKDLENNKKYYIPNSRFGCWIFVPLTNDNQKEHYQIGQLLRSILVSSKKNNRPGYSNCLYGVCSKYRNKTHQDELKLNNLQLNNVEVSFKLIILESKPKVSAKNRYNF